MSTSALRLLAALLGMTLLAGCVGMPTSGPVVERPEPIATEDPPGISFDPRPPQPDQTTTEIVSGFLEAMEAAPIRTSVARQFLTARAQQSWAPEQGIITYADLSTPVGVERVNVEAFGVNTYDSRGAWEQSTDEQRLSFVLVREDGQWRIDRAPDALVVPASWFGDWYEPMSTYYFDPTAQILVPEPVYVPRGDQGVSELVRSLLSLPTDAADGVVRTFFPESAAPGLSVPISSAGVAEVTLDGDASAVDEDTAQRMLAQLAWTLRQVPRVRAVRLRVGDRAIGLRGGATQVNLDVGVGYAPTGYLTSTDLYALDAGLLVSGQPGDLEPTTGPFGSRRFGLGAVSVNLSGTYAAGVTADGSQLLGAAVDEADSDARTLLSGMVALQPPAWDHLDRMWVLDHNGGAARVFVVTQDSVREVRVPGMTGQAVKKLLVSRDGTRVVGLVRGPDSDSVRVARVRRSDTGGVRGIRRPRRLPLDVEVAPRLRDLAWRSPTTVSVLSHVSGDLVQVRTLTVDAAPWELPMEGVSRLRGRVRSLVSSPVPGMDAYALAGRVITDLARSERAVPALGEDITSLTYAG